MEFATEVPAGSEWDGGCFCSKCYKMMHWTETAYLMNGRYYCKDCITQMKGVIINRKGE